MPGRNTAFLFLVTPEGPSPFAIRLDQPAKDLQTYFREMGVRTASLYPLPVEGVALYLDDDGMMRGANDPKMDRNTALMDVLTNFIQKSANKPYASQELQQTAMTMWTSAPIFGGAALVFETAESSSFRDDLRRFILDKVAAKKNPNISVSQ